MQNEITSYLISFQYFVHPPGVASSARYRLLIYCCGMAAHIWWITHMSSTRCSCSGCARTMRFNRPNTWSIGYISRLFAGRLSFCTLFPTHITSVLLAAWHDAYLVPTSHRDWHGYEEDEPTEWRQFHTSPWMGTLPIFVCMNTLERHLLCLFSPY